MTRSLKKQEESYSQSLSTKAIEPGPRGCADSTFRGHNTDFAGSQWATDRSACEEPSEESDSLPDPDVLAQEIVVPRLASLGTTPSQGRRPSRGQRRGVEDFETAFGGLPYLNHSS